MATVFVPRSFSVMVRGVLSSRFEDAFRSISDQDGRANSPTSTRSTAQDAAEDALLCMMVYVRHICPSIGIEALAPLPLANMLPVL